MDEITIRFIAEFSSLTSNRHTPFKVLVLTLKALNYLGSK